MQALVTPRLVRVPAVRSNVSVKAIPSGTRAAPESFGWRFLALLLTCLSAPNS
jgi:hypothetical protein